MRQGFCLGPSSKASPWIEWPTFENSEGVLLLESWAVRVLAELERAKQRMIAVRARMLKSATLKIFLENLCFGVTCNITQVKVAHFPLCFRRRCERFGRASAPAKGRANYGTIVDCKRRLVV